MVRLIAAVLLCPLGCLAQHPHEREVQRALIELDRRAADFSSNRPPLEPQVGQPLNADPEVARQLRPYERMRMAEQHVLQLPPPVVREKAEPPLPLPGRPQRAVDPVTLPGVRD
jgi:hypothetical protein